MLFLGPFFTDSVDCEMSSFRMLALSIQDLCSRYLEPSPNDVLVSVVARSLSSKMRIAESNCPAQAFQEHDPHEPHPTPQGSSGERQHSWVHYCD
jgi:hypothetical protein